MTQKERLVALINEAQIECDDNYGMTHSGQMADFLLDNGVILPPVRVGDTVWDNDFGDPKSYTVTGFDIGKTMDDDVEHRELFVYYQNWNGSITCSAPVSIFGKTVFLTREEAEAALDKTNLSAGFRKMG